MNKMNPELYEIFVAESFTISHRKNTLFGSVSNNIKGETTNQPN